MINIVLLFFYLFIMFFILLMIYLITVNTLFQYLEKNNLTLLIDVLNEIPFLQISSDENFHTYNKNKNNRYSMIYIPFGVYKIYLFTYDKIRHKFNFFKKISLIEICSKRINELENKLSILSIEHLQKYQFSKNKKKHIEIIKDLYEEYEEREKIAQYKAMFYTTILTIIVSVPSLLKEKETYFIINFVIFLIFLYLINIIMLLISLFSVKKYQINTYNDFIKSLKKDDFYYQCWYKKYRRKKIYSNRDITYIRNIEKYFKISIFWIIILCIIKGLIK